MIDESTRDRIEAVILRSQHDGVNMWDALDRAGLIVTSQQTYVLWARCLEQLRTNVELQTVHDLVQLGGGQNTPMDAVRGVLTYIDFCLRQYQRQARERL